MFAQTNFLLYFIVIHAKVWTEKRTETLFLTENGCIIKMQKGKISNLAARIWLLNERRDIFETAAVWGRHLKQENKSISQKNTWKGNSWVRDAEIILEYTCILCFISPSRNFLFSAYVMVSSGERAIGAAYRAASVSEAFKSLRRRDLSLCARIHDRSRDKRKASNPISKKILETTTLRA